MCTSKETVANYLKSLNSLGMGEWTAKAMFGEYAVYFDEKVVALICDDQLFLKASPEALANWGEYETAPPYPRAKPLLLVQESDFLRTEELVNLIKTSLKTIKKPTKRIACR